MGVPKKTVISQAPIPVSVKPSLLLIMKVGTMLGLNSKYTQGYWPLRHAGNLNQSEAEWHHPMASKQCQYLNTEKIHWQAMLQLAAWLRQVQFRILHVR